MCLFQVICVLIMITSVTITSRHLDPGVGLNIIQFAARHKYPLETHQVQTEDGYVLTLHRIRRGLQSSTRRPVLLMHGIFCSSIDWINLGPGKALGLLLADQGYDVWLGNHRGTTWSRRHIKLDPDLNSKRFFDFTVHEIGVYDLPAKVDYILRVTNQTKLSYVGHSQGTTMFFVMASEKPEYNDKIRLMVALAPIAYIGHMPNVFGRTLANYWRLLNILSEVFRVYEFLPHNFIFEIIRTRFCPVPYKEGNICLLIIDLFGGFSTLIEPELMAVVFSNLPAGSSTKQFLHYLQLVKSGRFSRYDYGIARNLIEYGRETVPEYNITKITTPIILHYGDQDSLTSTSDIKKLARKLPNVLKVHKIPFDGFTHLDFLWAQNVVKVLYDNVITEINNRN